MTQLWMTLARIAVGGMLFFSGLAKLDSLYIFTEAVKSYQLLPEGWAFPVSYVLVSAELILGLTLWLGYQLSGASLLASCLFLTFAGALASVLWRELTFLSCGCENVVFEWLSGSHAPTWAAVFIDGMLAAVSASIAFSRQQGYRLLTFRTHKSG